MSDTYCKITSSTKISVNNILANYPIEGKCRDEFNPEHQNEVLYYKVFKFILEDSELELTPANDNFMMDNYQTVLSALHKHRNELDNGFWWIKNNI